MRALGRALPDTLVLSGGGLRGLHGLGALAQLRNAGALRDVRHVVGTSSGAILGAMLATNQLERGLGLAMRQRGTWDIQLHKLASRYGIDSGRMLDDLLDRLFEGRADLTFRELLEDTGLDLHVCATNLSLRSPTYFCAADSPDMPVREAVRHSCTLPVLFSVLHAEYVYVDGGLVANLPVQRGRRVSKTGRILAIGYTTRATGRAPVTDLKSFLTALAETATSPCEQPTPASPREQFLFLDTGPVALEFDADAQKRLAWFMDGANQAKHFLKKRK